MAVITKLELEEAKTDVDALEAFVNGDADPGTFTTRLGTSLKTLALLQEEVQGALSYAVLDDVPALRLYSRPVGTVAVLLRGWASEYDGRPYWMLYDASSGDADDGVDAIVGADAVRWRRLAPPDETQEISLDGGRQVPNTGGANPSQATNGTWQTSISGLGVNCFIPVVPGWVVTGIRARGQLSAGTGAFQARLGSSTGTTLVGIGTGGSSNSAVTGTPQDVTSTPNHTMVANSRVAVMVDFVGNASSTVIHSVWATISKKPPAV